MPFLFLTPFAHYQVRRPGLFARAPRVRARRARAIDGPSEILSPLPNFFRGLKITRAQRGSSGPLLRTMRN